MMPKLAVNVTLTNYPVIKMHLIIICFDISTTTDNTNIQRQCHRNLPAWLPMTDFQIFRRKSPPPPTQWRERHTIPVHRAKPLLTLLKSSTTETLDPKIRSL